MKKFHRYTPEQVEYIASICIGRLKSEIRDLFNEKFNASVTNSSIRSIMDRNNFKSGLRGKAGAATHFKKGHKPWNKDVKGLMLGGDAGWFKKGHDHWKTLPIGSESVREGLMMVKVDHPNVWEKKHLRMWREAHGEIPPGRVIRFKDGNKMNVTLENLFMVEQRVMTSVVRRGIDNDIPEVKVAIHNLARLELAIKDKALEMKGE